MATDQVVLDTLREWENLRSSGDIPLVTCEDRDHWIFDLKEVMNILKAEIVSCQTQLSSRNAEIVTQHLPDDEYREYRQWRARTTYALGEKIKQQNKLKEYLRFVSMLEVTDPEQRTLRQANAYLSELRSELDTLEAHPELGDTDSLPRHLVRGFRHIQRALEAVMQRAGESKTA